jgi:nitrite reductase/ring-hydroxylating ferredoxin subunit
MTDRGLRVYFNVCRHVPVPLDAGSFVAPVDDGDWVCDTHGARYDLSSGYCHTGPCLGSSLLPVRVELEDGVLYGWFGEDGGPET